MFREWPWTSFCPSCFGCPFPSPLRRSGCSLHCSCGLCSIHFYRAYLALWKTAQCVCGSVVVRVYMTPHVHHVPGCSFKGPSHLPGKPPGGRGCFVNGLGLRFAQAALVALSLHLCGDRAAACIVPAAFAAFTSTEPIWRCGKQLSVYVAASWSGFTYIYIIYIYL